MRKRMKSKLRQILPYIFCFAAFLILSSYIQDRNDDLVFRDSYNQYDNLTQWVQWFSLNWGGRVIPQGLLVVILQMPPIVFMILNATAAAVLAFFSKRYVDGNHDVSDASYCFVFTVGLLFMIPQLVLRGTLYWKCADVLYLWGFSALFAALHPCASLLRGRRISIPGFIAALFGTVYTASFEQAGICMVGMMTVLTGYHFLFQYHKGNGLHRKSENGRSDYVKVFVLLAAAAALTALFCLLPGNKVRFEEETVRWYPQFIMYSVPEKILLGLAYAVNGLEEHAVMILVAAAWLAMTSHLKKGKPRIDMFVSIAVFIYFVLMAIDRVSELNGSEGWFSGFFAVSKPEIDEYLFEGTAIVRNLLHYAAYLGLGYAVTSMPEKKTDPIAFTLCFGGLGSLVLMGFSPTISSSQARPVFPGCLMMILLVLREYCVWRNNQKTCCISAG